MLRDDYITRLIEKLSVVTVRVNALKLQRQWDEARQAIRDASQQLLGIHPAIIDRLPYRDLIQMIGGNRRELRKGIIVAELLKLEAEIARARGDDAKSFQQSLKSLNILIMVLLEDAQLRSEPYYSDQVEALAAAVAEYEIPADSKQLLFQYYEATGKYGKAEDMLYELLEEETGRAAWIEQGIGFYQRLLAKGEAELAGGNLPRAELIEGLERLEKYRLEVPLA